MKPFLSTSRLDLWPVTEQDHEFASGLYTDPSMMTHLGGPRPNDTGKVRMPVWLAQWRELGYGFCVAKNKGGEKVGVIAIFPTSHDERVGDAKALEIGWMISPLHQKNGYAYEAAKGIVDFAKAKLPTRTLVCYPGRENVPSNRIAEKLGFKRIAEVSYSWLGVLLHTVHWQLDPV